MGKADSLNKREDWAEKVEKIIKIR